MKSLTLFVCIMLAGVIPPVWGRVEAYNNRTFTQVGRGRGAGACGGPAFRGGPRGRRRPVIIDRGRGPGWGGVVAGGLIGAAAGLALGSAIAGPPAVAYAPPPMYTVVPALPGACGYQLMYQVVPGP
ncbi:MAG TPA: hypothetical protein VKV17_07530 [Bryobacteraceae bacterium]|nr:hypothetical protein [Bryobacteraceae bacterium]